MEVIIINNNKIEELRKINKNFPFLHVIDVSDNYLYSDYELRFVKKLKELYEVNFQNNPFCSEEVTQEFIQENVNLEVVNNIEIRKPGEIQIKRIEEIRELVGESPGSETNYYTN